MSTVYPTRFVLLLWLLAMAVLGLFYITLPPSPDQSQFDWMAFAATRGLPYYAGSFDMNWPGAMWLHEAGIRLFGVHAWTWRLTDFLLLLGFTFVGALFLARAEWPRAAIFFLLLYPLLYTTSGTWMAGQRDIVAAGFLLAASAASLPGGRREGPLVVSAGVLVAMAVLIRPTYLSFLAGLLFLEALPPPITRPRQLSRVGRAVRMVAGFVLAVGLVIVVGLALGNLDDWYEQSVLFSLSLYVGAWPQEPLVTLTTLFVRSWHWITLLALVGAAFWIRRDGAGHALVLTFGIAATAAVSFAAQGKGFGYHLGGVLIVLVLLITVAFDGLVQTYRAAQPGLARTALMVATLLAAGLVLAGTASKLAGFAPGMRLLLAGDLGPREGYGLTETERRTIVEMLQNDSGPDDTVAVYGTNYELPYRAERLPNYRFFTPAADQIQPDFPLYDTWLAEIDAALTDTPPAFVIIARSMIEGSADARQSVMSDKPILRRLLAHVKRSYEVAFRNDDLVVYRAVSS